MALPSLRGRFNWHQLMASDPQAALDFYTRVVGWKTQPWEHDPGYTLLVGSRGPVAGVTGMPRDPTAPGAAEARPGWLSFIGTEDVDATVREAVSLGGRVIAEPADIPVGRIAVLADPQGAVFALYRPSPPAPMPETVEPGEFSWHELATTDPVAAFDFYQRLFGWEKTGAMDMGAMGIYQMYGWGEVMIGGFYRMMAEKPNWLAYAKVKATPRAVELTRQLGGSIINGPMEVPGGDLIAMCVDPQGVAFAVHSARPVAAAAPKPARPATSAKKPAKKAAKKPAKKAAKKPAKKVARKPAKKSAKRAPKRAAKKKSARRR
ncbi:MAG TPA: VOC family protein [Gemmatimonadales bacterium]|nr:VOC family protein [Gemmatimonadales bacterium]